MSQCTRLLTHLKTSPINPLEAWAKLGVYRLAARINDLRRDGHDIQSEAITVPNRFGEACRVAQYRFDGASNG